MEWSGESGSMLFRAGLEYTVHVDDTEGPSVTSVISFIRHRLMVLPPPPYSTHPLKVIDIREGLRRKTLSLGSVT